MSFRGHGERETSTRRGNLLDLLKWYANKKDDVKKVVLENAPKNDIMICPNIQKNIVSSCAKETLKTIVEDLNVDYFEILVDESKDVSHKEQIALILSYVNKEGKVIERFLSIVHVKDTSAKSLKEAIYSLLLEHSLSKSQIREQGYDGASNMQGEVNGLKTLIMNDTPSAYCIHCFPHQLEMLRDDQVKELEELLVLGEVHTGSGLNQELGLQRAGDTRWGSHFKTLRNFISLFSSIVHVLGVLAIDGSNYHERSMAKSLVDYIRSYDFVYVLHLMLKVLALTYDLNMALQKKDQDIVSAMKLVGFAKRQLRYDRF
uniref:Zinc finger MYM-type protein 1-like n=2 Tax=Nicotiana tabacum TaxID=4097 RepID=A0A1S4BH84_TOBAC|nr:PREDICTED: zinc finger MYM-type protein 1-like [Nicotiana tabacum]